MNNKFQEWVKSFSGCDGGELTAPTWLCGIEYGIRIDSKNINNYYAEKLKKEILQGYVNLNTQNNIFDDLSYPFNLSFAKIYSSIYGIPVSELGSSNKVLKLNLFPITFNKDQSSLWAKEIVEVTGCETKKDYTNFISNAFRFKEIRNKYKPRLIICVGNSRVHDFKKSFFGDLSIKFVREALRPEETAKNQNNRYINYAQHDGTLIVVVPFSTSASGLNSDYLLGAAGNRIKELLSD